MQAFWSEIDSKFRAALQGLIKILPSNGSMLTPPGEVRESKSETPRKIK